MHQSARHMVQHWKLVSLGKLFSITIFFKISLGSKTVATLDRGALDVLSTRIARQGRNVHLTFVSLLLLRIISAILTQTVLEPGYAPKKDGKQVANVSAVHVVMTLTVLEARDVPAASVVINVVVT